MACLAQCTLHGAGIRAYRAGGARAVVTGLSVDRLRSLRFV